MMLNLSAYLNGGIPNADIDILENYWRVFPQLRSVLFAPSQYSGYSQSLVEANQVKTTIECLEYVLVHELVHLLERHHNERFQAYMDQYLPQWRQCHEILNREPLGDI